MRIELVWLKHFMQILVFKVESVSCFSKKTYSAELKKRMYVSKENHLC
jgi:hypothetical protein